MKTVFFKKNMPSLSEISRVTKGRNFILLFDERLNHFLAFQKWRKSFQHQFAVRAGENLKNIESFAAHATRILPSLSGFAPSENILIAVGGGSVGDFAGFLASVLKRGVGLVSIPSTWLAAVDSAHGGKTGLNVGSLKNQVGTFYPAKAIFCVRELLDWQPSENIQSAYGEVLKISLIDPSGLYKKICRLKSFDAANLWRILPHAIRAKYAIVKRDPFESKGIRHLLNLGHTVGHVYEIEKLLTHGTAVQMGLEFAVEWSYKIKIMNLKNYTDIKKLFAKNKMRPIQPLKSERFQYLLRQDKKMTGGDHLRFVFIRKPGQAIIREIPIAEVTQAALELGWAQ